MSVVSQIAKKAVKKLPKTATEVVEKTAREIAENVAGTAISSEAKLAAKKAAVSGEKLITKAEAQKATKTAYQFAAQKDVALSDTVSSIVDWANTMKARKAAGEITDNQAVKVAGELRKQFSPLKMAKEESRASRSGSGQILETAAENPDIVRLNTMLEGAEQYLNSNNVWQNIEMLSNLRSPEQLETLGVMKKEMANRGQLESFYNNATHIAKNLMLLARPINRLADAGANIFTRGVSLFDLAMAEGLQKAGKRLSPAFKGKKLAEILSSPGIYEGSTIKSLNGSTIAVTDYLITGGKNLWNWTTGQGEKIKETLIGKHSRKMTSEYVWQTQKEVANFVLPKDINDMIRVLKENPVKAPIKAAGKVVSDAGFGLASTADSIPAGAFRAGSLSQDAYQMAYLKAADVGKLEDKEFIDRLAKNYILADNGTPLPKNTVDEYINLFGPGGFEDAAASVAKQATQEAERDTLRTKPITMVGKGLENLYGDIIKLPLVGKLFDLRYPLARAPIRMLDRFFYENPFSTIKRIGKVYKKARYELEKTGATNSAELYKELGLLVNGAAAYTVAGTLAWNGILAGDLPEDKGERALWERTNKKANSINIGNESIPFDRWGKPGVVLGYIARLFQDIKDIHDNYEDDSNTYGWADAAGDLIGAFTVNAVWPTVFANMADDFSAGRLTRKTVQQYTKLLPRAINSLMQDLGVETEDDVIQVFVDARKKISETKLRLRPKTDAFGDKIKGNTWSRNKDIITDEWDRVGFKPNMPYDTYSATVNDMEIGLYPIERSVWNSFMNHFQVYDSEGNPTGEWSSVEKELFDVIHGGKDATKEGDLYFEIGNTQLSPEGERLATQKAALQNIYNDAKRNALLTFLSYKDKYVDTDEEKEYSRLAKLLWKRAESAKKNKMKPIPSLDIGE